MRQKKHSNEPVEGGPICWCGNRSLTQYNGEYCRCLECETLVLAHPPAPEALKVEDDEHDFYGRKYYQEHLPQEYGFPSLWERARLDLPERCLYWLRLLLQYRLPPGQLLELGSAHGAFVALLRWAGFDASGLELSPWLVEQSRETFSIPVLLGPIEEQNLEKESLDAIVLMDVLEHLPDPKRTMACCLQLLNKDGFFLLQTPSFRPELSYEDLVKREDPFLMHLKPKEHLFLFSPVSMNKFFSQLGVSHLHFEPAIFAHYDMTLVASQTPLTTTKKDELNRALRITPSGRLVQALLDLGTKKNAGPELKDLASRLEKCEADRAARLEVIHCQGSKISCMENEVHLRLDENKRLWEKLNREEGERKQASAEWMAFRNPLSEIVKSQQLQLEKLGKAIQEIAGARENMENWFLQFQPLAQQLPALSREIELLRSEQERLQFALDKTEKLLDQQREDFSVYQKENQEIKAETQAQKEVLQNQNIQLEGLRQQNDQLVRGFESVQRSISEKDRQIQDSDNRYSNLKYEILSLEEEKQKLRDEMDRLELLLNDRQMAWSDLEFLHEQLSHSCQETQESLEEKTAQIQHISARNEMLEIELGQREEGIQNLSKKLNRAEDIIQNLRQLLCRIEKTSAVRLLKNLGGWQWLKEDSF